MLYYSFFRFYEKTLSCSSLKNIKEAYPDPIIEETTPSIPIQPSNMPSIKSIPREKAPKRSKTFRDEKSIAKIIDTSLLRLGATDAPKKTNPKPPTPLDISILKIYESHVSPQSMLDPKYKKKLTIAVHIIKATADAGRIKTHLIICPGTELKNSFNGCSLIIVNNKS